MDKALEYDYFPKYVKYIKRCAQGSRDAWNPLILNKHKGNF